MRPILFQFYIIEISLNLILILFRIHGFLLKPLELLPLWSYICLYFSLVVFYIFTVLIMFASINICTGHQVSMIDEVIRNMVGFLLYIFVSLIILENAEQDFHLFTVWSDTKLGVEMPLHPVFSYMRVQALCALTCGVIFLLHGIIVIDVLMSTEQLFDENDSGSEEDERDIIPVRLYVMGELVQSRLQRYKWFNDLDRDENLYI